jgi:hypothetical protein
LDSEKKKVKDDWAIVKQTNSFEDYQYWKLPERYNIEDLMREQDQ